jgi:hypothetical protein
MSQNGIAVEGQAQAEYYLSGNALLLDANKKAELNMPGLFVIDR